MAPFFVFQVFRVLLWLRDEYWYYSLLTLFMLILAEAQMIHRRLHDLSELRGMRIPSRPVQVFRENWKLDNSDRLLPGDVVLTGLHLLLTSLRVTIWWEHVDTHANPADGGSRQGTSCKLAKRLGIPLQWVKFPFVPACMAAAGPTEWLKFFKTFA